MKRVVNVVVLMRHFQNYVTLEWAFFSLILHEHCQTILFPEDMPTHSHGDAALLFDKRLCGSIEDIVVCECPFLRDIQWRLAWLPIRFGGLWLYAAVETSSYAFLASQPKSWCHMTISYEITTYVVWILIMFVFWLVFVVWFQNLTLELSLIRKFSS